MQPPIFIHLRFLKTQRSFKSSCTFAKHSAFVQSQLSPERRTFSSIFPSSKAFGPIVMRSG